jgi:hypothetical protein
MNIFRRKGSKNQAKIRQKNQTNNQRYKERVKRVMRERKVERKIERKKCKRIKLRNKRNLQRLCYNKVMRNSPS